MFSETYTPNPSYDELIAPSGQPREAALELATFLASLGHAQLRSRQRAAECDIRASGITFTVYDDSSNIDREWPFDIIPRVLPAAEWARLERGLIQRLTALNAFIHDVYGEQRVIRDGVFPAEVLATSKNYRAQCRGMRPKFGVWAHISGTDLVRDADGTMYVLEDNLRVPSGVSYMLENRKLTKRIFPELFERQCVQPVGGYVGRLFESLVALAPEGVLEPSIVVLTPGVYNSAYFEHCFLAQQMGVELVEGRDLVTLSDDCVYVKTIGGLERVHVIYRRIDDIALDPDVFAPDSLLGCRGLLRAWRAGNVALVNAPGAGVADDKLVYSYVPELIRYYLGEDAIIPNVPTLRLIDAGARRKVLGELRRFVVKPVNESGGYGVVIGPSASASELEACAGRIQREPRNYVAQPVIDLSVAPTLCGAAVEPRHLDLRPFVLSGATPYVTRGGLTRVARRKGSLIVNSSQGGGSKDTWVVNPRTPPRDAAIEG
jgi:uncharacterized circularly permuted ATP-grasp superfamily protein